VIWNHQKVTKRVRPQNTIYSADQPAIITAIQFTMKEPGEKVIATDSLNTLTAASDKKDTKNPKTQTIWKLLEQEVAKITLLWVSSHVGIPGNKKSDNTRKLRKIQRVSLELDDSTTRSTTTKMGLTPKWEIGNNKKQGETTPARWHAEIR
jgi:hypothetical protein